MKYRQILSNIGLVTPPLREATGAQICRMFHVLGPKWVKNCVKHVKFDECFRFWLKFARKVLQERLQNDAKNLHLNPQNLTNVSRNRIKPDFRWVNFLIKFLMHFFANPP